MMQHTLLRINRIMPTPVHKHICKRNLNEENHSDGVSMVTRKSHLKDDFTERYVCSAQPLKLIKKHCPSKTQVRLPQCHMSFCYVPDIGIFGTQ